MRHLAFLLVTYVLAAGCGRDRPPETPTEPSATSTPSASTLAPSSSIVPLPTPSAEPASPAMTLRERLAEYDWQWNAAATRRDADAVTARFVTEVAQDRSISDGEIRQAIQANTHDVAKLHEGPVRTYPDRRTMHALLGIASALQAALRARGAN